MTENKRTIERYMAGFRATDHAAILSCLTDDVEWEIPGMFRSRGKAAFDQEIENDAFVGHPDIMVTRLVEENDVVVAEGSVRTQQRGGGELRLRFCDVFVMEAGRIRHLTSYLTDFKQHSRQIVKIGSLWWLALREGPVGDNELEGNLA